MILMSEVIIIPSDGSSVEEGEIVEFEEGEIVDDDEDVVPPIVKDKKSNQSPKTKNSVNSGIQNANHFSKSKTFGTERNSFSYNEDVDSFSVEKRKRRGGKVGNNNFRKYRENKFSGAAQKRGARGRKRNHSPYRSFNGKDVNRDGDDSNSSYDKKLEEYVKIKSKQKELERAEAEAAAANDVDMRTMSVAAHPIVPPAFESYQHPQKNQQDNWADDISPDAWDSNGKSLSSEPPWNEEGQQIKVIESQKDVWKERLNPPPWIKQCELWNEKEGENINRPWNGNVDPWIKNSEMPLSDKPPDQWNEKPPEPWMQPPEFNLPLPPPPPPWQFPSTTPWPWPMPPPPWNQPPLPWPAMVPGESPWPQFNLPNLNTDKTDVPLQPQEISFNQRQHPSGENQIPNSILQNAEKKGDTYFESEEPLPPGVDGSPGSPKKPSKIAFTIKQPPPLAKTTPAPAFDASLHDDDGSGEEEELQLRIEALRSAMVKRQAKYRECRGRRNTRWNDPDEPLLPLPDSTDSISNKSEEIPPIQESPASPDIESPESPPHEHDLHQSIDATFKDEEEIPSSSAKSVIPSDISTSDSLPGSSLSLTEQISSSPVCPPLASSEDEVAKSITDIDKSSSISELEQRVEENCDKKLEESLGESKKEASTGDQGVNEEDEEQRLRRLAVLSFKKRKFVFSDLDENSQNSSNSVMHDEKVEVKKKEVISDDDIWNDLYIDENAISNSDEEKAKDDWDELDEDVLRAELLRGLVRSLPSTKDESEGNETQDKETMNKSLEAVKEINDFVLPAEKEIKHCQIVKKESISVNKTVPDPKVETKTVVSTKLPLATDSKLAVVKELKIDTRPTTGKEAVKSDRSASANKELNRLSQEWSEKMVPRLVVCLDNSDSESDSDLGRSVDQLLLEARQHSDKDVRAKKSKAQAVKIPTQIAPVTPVAMRHLPEERQKEYMLLKKILAKKEREMLAKRGQKIVSKESQDEKTDSDNSCKLVESEDTVLTDETNGGSPCSDVRLLEEELSGIKNNLTPVDKSTDTLNKSEEVVKTTLKDSKFLNVEEMEVDINEGCLKSTIENVTPCSIKAEASEETATIDDLNSKLTSQINTQQIVPQQTEMCSNESTIVTQVTSSTSNTTLDIQNEENRDSSTPQNMPLNVALKALPPARRPPMLAAAAAAAGPLRHRLPATIVRESAATGLISKRNSTEEAENEPEVKRVCLEPTDAPELNPKNPIDDITPLQRIRSTASLAAELLGKAAAGCEEWGKRESAARAKVVEAQKQLDDAKRQLNLCTAHREVSAKAGACHYAEALRALRLWHGLSKVRDKDRTIMMSQVKRDMQRIRGSFCESSAKMSPPPVNHENSRLSGPDPKLKPPSQNTALCSTVPSTPPVITLKDPSKDSSQLPSRRKRPRKRRRSHKLVAKPGGDQVGLPTPSTVQPTPSTVQPTTQSSISSCQLKSPCDVDPKTLTILENLKAPSPVALPMSIAALPAKDNTLQDGVWDDPDAVLCPFQLSGTCLDSSCSFKHILR